MSLSPTLSTREREQTADLLNRISRDRSMIVNEHDMEFALKIAAKIKQFLSV